MRGQTALAYLVMLAAILTIAVTGVVIFQSMLSPAEAANIVLDDKYQASILGIKLVDYTTPYQGSKVTAPNAVVYNQEPRKVVLYDDLPREHGDRLMDIGANKVLGKFAMNDDGATIGLQSFYSKFKEVGTDSVTYNINGKSVPGQNKAESAEGQKGVLSSAMCNSKELLESELGLNANSDISVVAEAYATIYTAAGIVPAQITGKARKILVSGGWIGSNTNEWLKAPNNSLVSSIQSSQQAN